MPFMNWTERSVQIETKMNPEATSQMTIVLGVAERDELLEALTEVFSGPFLELRLDLPRKWTVFWKIKTGDSRVLLAHPEVDTWVATVAVTTEASRLLLDQIRDLKAGEASLDIGLAVDVSSVSNLELALKIPGSSG